MTTFDEREKAFERKFAFDEELRFKSTVRRNKLTGLWAAEKLGLSGEDAEAYAKSIVKADFQEAGDSDVLRKLQADFAAKGIQMSEDDLHRVLIDKLAEAVRQIEADKRKGILMSADTGGGPIRAKLAAGKPLFNAWLALGSPFAVELAAEAGCDLVTVDQQHGIGGHAEMLSCLMAAGAGGVPALVRVAANDSGLIGRALDAGAHGVICPMINSADDAWQLVDSVKFPPLGRRSLGPFRARLAMPDYFRAANAWTIACGQIETTIRARQSRQDSRHARPRHDLRGPERPRADAFGRRTY